MSQDRLRITTATSISDLQYFLRDKDSAELHAKRKRNKDGTSTYILYARKGGGSGISYRLGESRKTRQLHARVAILRIIAHYNGSTVQQKEFARNFRLYEQLLQEQVPAPLPIDADDAESHVKQLEDFLYEGLSTKKPVEGLQRRRGLRVMDIRSHLQPDLAAYVTDAPKNPEIDYDPTPDLNAIALRFENQKAKTLFNDLKSYLNSPLDNKPALPAHRDLAEALEKAVFASTMFPGNKISGESGQLRETAVNFIINNKLKCPFPLPEVIQEILGLGLSIDRKIGQGLGLLIDRGLQKPDDVQHAARELETMMTDLTKIEFGAKLFTDENFIGQVQPNKQQEVRELGEALGILHDKFSHPASIYQSTIRLAELAVFAPAYFSKCLANFKSKIETESANWSQYDSSDAGQIM